MIFGNSRKNRRVEKLRGEYDQVLGLYCDSLDLLPHPWVEVVLSNICADLLDEVEAFLKYCDSDDFPLYGSLDYSIAMAQIRNYIFELNNWI